MIRYHRFRWYATLENKGHVPFDQNFWKFGFKIKWNRKFPETHFENFGQPLEVVLFSGNLEIQEIFRSILTFLPGMNRPQFVWSCLKATRWRRIDTTLDAKRFVTVRTLYWLSILHKHSWICFSEKLWTCRSEFPVSICPVCIISCKKSSQVYYLMKIILKLVR